MYIILVLFFFSCDEKDNVATPDRSFSKIIDSKTYDETILPWDIKETEDLGFITLSSQNLSAFKSIHIMKIDQQGEFEWEINDSSEFVNPLPYLFERDNQFYIFAMQQVTLETHLLRIDEESQTLIDEQSYADFLYPLAANEVPGGYLIESFDRDAQRLRVMKLSATFDEVWRERYNVFEDPIEFEDHLLKTDPLPFFCGHVGTESSASSYFVGGMYNFTLNTMFLNPSDGILTKRITGFRYEAGVSQLLNTFDNNFFLMKHNLVGENTILTNFSIDVTDGTTLNSQNEEDVPEEISVELPNRAKTVLKKVTLNGQERVMHLTENNNQEVNVNLYNLEGDLINTRKLGLDTPQFLGNVVISSDGGMVVLTKTFISSRIAKLSVTKYSSDDISGI